MFACITTIPSPLPVSPSSVFVCVFPCHPLCVCVKGITTHDSNNHNNKLTAITKSQQPKQQEPHPRPRPSQPSS